MSSSPDRDPAASVLGRYDRIEQAAALMLEAARAGDWARVAQMEQVIGTLAEPIDELLRVSTLDARQQRERLLAVRRLLSIDAEVRHLSDPSTLRLDRMLDRRVDHEHRTPRR